MPNDPQLINAFTGPARDFLARQHNADGTHSGGNPAVPRQSVVLFGDSITSQCYFVGTSTDLSPQGYWAWANARLGQRFTLLANSGISGNTSAQMLARVQADVIAYNPGYCVLQASANDFGTMTAAQSIANLYAIYDAVRAAGIVIVATTLVPGQAVNAAKDKAAAINEAIRQYAYTRQGVCLCDWTLALANPNGDGSAATGMLQVDNIHPDVLGGMRLGWALANQLASFPTPLPILPSFVGAPTGLLPTPLMAGIVSIDRYTGGVNPTFTNSQVARTDGIQGIWQQFAVTACPNGWRVRQDTTNVGTDWNIGDVIYGVAEFQCDTPVVAVEASGRAFAALRLEVMDAGSAVLAVATSPRDGVGVATTETIAAGVFRTSNLVIPATATRLRLAYQSGFTGTQRIGRMEIRKAPVGTVAGPVG